MKRKFVLAKLTALAITATTAMGAFSPMVAHAAPISEPPSAKVAIDSSVATVAAHRAAETAPMILGANLTTTGGVNDVMLDTFGSDYNIRPNQYLYNYRVSQTGNDVIKVLTIQVSPMMADVDGPSVDTKSDIYLGNQANGGVTYEDLLGNDYVYRTLAYGCNDITAMKNTMTTMASTIEDDLKKQACMHLHSMAVRVRNRLQQTM